MSNQPSRDARPPYTIDRVDLTRLSRDMSNQNSNQLLTSTREKRRAMPSDLSRRPVLFYFSYTRLYRTALQHYILQLSE